MKTASGSDKVTIKNIAKASSTPDQTSKMDPFARTFNKLELLTLLTDTYIYIKNATPDVSQGPVTVSFIVCMGRVEGQYLAVYSLLKAHDGRTKY